LKINLLFDKEMFLKAVFKADLPNLERLWFGLDNIEVV